ncbi:hypothetical protein ACFL6C_07285 [Myxococcota bacterium]
MLDATKFSDVRPAPRQSLRNFVYITVGMLIATGGCHVVDEITNAGLRASDSGPLPQAGGGDLEPQGTLDRIMAAANELWPHDTEVSIPVPAATVDSVEGTVEIRASGTAVWKPLEKGETVEPGDEVRSAEMGRARIVYLGRAALNVRPNSLVVFREAARNEDDTRAVMQLELRSGFVVTRLSGGKKQVAVLRFSTDVGVMRVSSEDSRNHRAQAEVSAQEGQLSIQMRLGESMIITRTGDLRVARDEKGTMGVTGTLSKARVVYRSGSLKTPRLLSPANKTRFSRDTAEVVLKWGEIKEATTYHLQVARSKSFGRLFVDDFVDAGTFAFEPLGDLILYWRVRAIGPGNDRSEFSRPRSMHFKKGRSGRTTGGPVLTVSSPEDGEITHSDKIVVEGKTVPGASVWVNEQPVRPDKTGVFKTQVRLNKGMNSIVIEARDKKSRRTFKSRSVVVK